MPESTSTTTNAEADVATMSSVSKIWIVPILALGIGVWMVYYQWANKGPTITIEFSTAQGIEPDKTKIKSRSVDIGVVKSVALKDDSEGVIVTARIDPSAEMLLRENTNFWVVTPRVSLSGITGLNTLLSGPYIELEGTDTGPERYEFIGLDVPPVTPAGTPGLHVTLNSDDKFAFNEGDPIIYKGLKVGEFEDIYFNLEERIVYYNAFIEAPYHKLITENTKFWNTSGIRFELEASGITVEAGSIETLLTNGVTFGVPEGMPAGQQITQRSFFDIYPDYKSVLEQRYKLGVNFVIMIDDTVRGLRVGAPVEYRGLEVGKVLEINLQTPTNDGTILDEEYSIPVLITIQPSRIHLPDNRIGTDIVEKQITHWIGQGLRASLKIGNLVTGGMYVDLQHYPEERTASIESFMGYDIIPTRGDEFNEITQKVTAMLDSINRLPLEDISNNVNEVLIKLNDTSTAFKEAAQSVDALLIDAKEQQLAKNLNRTLDTLNTVLADFSTGSASHDSLLQSMESFEQTMQQLTPLLQQLNQTPNSLIFADSVGPQLEPKASSALTGDNDEN